jgi:hypothetical protein
MHGGSNNSRDQKNVFNTGNVRICAPSCRRRVCHGLDQHWRDQHSQRVKSRAPAANNTPQAMQTTLLLPVKCRSVMIAPVLVCQLDLSALL